MFGTGAFDMDGRAVLATSEPFGMDGRAVGATSGGFGMDARAVGCGAFGMDARAVGSGAFCMPARRPGALAFVGHEGEGDESFAWARGDGTGLANNFLGKKCKGSCASSVHSSVGPRCSGVEGEATTYVSGQLSSKRTCGWSDRVT